jgi:hypothetical protein
MTSMTGIRTVLHPVTDLDKATGRVVATFTDPDGNVLGLLEDPETA